MAVGMDISTWASTGSLKLVFVTAIITSLFVGVLLKKVLETLLGLLMKPVRFAAGALYRLFAPRNPLSISLRTYRSHLLRSKLAKIENPVGPNLDIPLEQAFAPLKLHSLAGHERSIDLFEHAASATRFIVLGGPGTGKSTLMKSLVVSIARKRCHPALNGLVPVFVTLRKLAQQQGSVDDAIVSALADHHFPGAASFVSSSLDAGRMLIVLDGLDEVGASREFVVRAIAAFCQFDSERSHPNRVFVTCRDSSYRTKDLREWLPEEVQIEPFANHHMRVFLEGWPSYKGRTAITLYRMIQNDSQIRDICRNPLLLTILTGIYLDSEDFELPSSRARFYEATMDELLEQRPGRRQIVQRFQERAKRAVLEQVSLELLGSVALGVDVEEFSHQRLQSAFRQFFRDERFDADPVIEEMLGTNGIIRATGKETYTCAHRTIQEFLASREVLRSREIDDIVSDFAARPELLEVLYFCCGSIENIPVLTRIVESFLERDLCIEAGLAIVRMKQAPPEPLVSRVSRLLQQTAEKNRESGKELATLSSLASRKGKEFDESRQIFNGLVESLAGSDADSSGLESAISTSPEIALRVVPGLLRHRSERWRAAAVLLLRDIGTDESLDQLVQLLADPDAFLRKRAAALLAGMMATRPNAIRRRAVLLPPRRDDEVWPIDRYFPAAIAIPIAEALQDSWSTGSESINLAVRVIRQRNTGIHDRPATWWRRMPRLFAFRRLEIRLIRVLAVIGSIGTFWTPIVAMLLSLAALRSGTDMALSTASPHVLLVDTALKDDARSQSANVLDRLSVATKLRGTLPLGYRNATALLTSCTRSDSDIVACAAEARELDELIPVLGPAPVQTLQKSLSRVLEGAPERSLIRITAVNQPSAIHDLAFKGSVVVFFICLGRSIMKRVTIRTLRKRRGWQELDSVLHHAGSMGSAMRHSVLDICLQLSGSIAGVWICRSLIHSIPGEFLSRILAGSLAAAVTAVLLSLHLQHQGRRLAPIHELLSDDASGRAAQSTL